MRRGRLVATAVLAVTGVTAGSAYALTAPTVTESNNQHGHATSLHFEADTSTAENNGAQAQSFVINIARGFRVDSRALTASCTPDQAKQFACPAGARVGGGTVSGHAEGPPVFVPNGREDFEAKMDAFLGPPSQPGDLYSVQLQVDMNGQHVTGAARLVPLNDPTYGMALRVDNVNAGQPSLPPGVKIYIDHVSFDAGGSRKVTVTKIKKKTVRRHHKRKRIKVKVHKKITYSLLTNPPTCNGSFPYSLTVTYDSAPPSTTDGGVDCR